MNEILIFDKYTIYTRKATYDYDQDHKHTFFAKFPDGHIKKVGTLTDDYNGFDEESILELKYKNNKVCFRVVEDKSTYNKKLIFMDCQSFLDKELKDQSGVFGDHIIKYDKTLNTKRHYTDSEHHKRKRPEEYAIIREVA